MAERLPTELEGVVLIEPEVHGDRRGFLVETWRAGAWRELGVDVDFVQHNHSRSVGGTLRGLHFQTSPGQAKLVRCIRGEIFDVAVDLRRDSPGFGRWEGHRLDDDQSEVSQRQQLLWQLSTRCDGIAVDLDTASRERA